MVGVCGQVVEQLRQVISPPDTTEHDYVVGARGSDDLDKRLHPDGGIGYSRTLARAFEPAQPAAVLAADGGLREWLVEQVEYDRIVVRESLGHAAPEGNRLRRVRHGLFARCLCGGTGR